MLINDELIHSAWHLCYTAEGHCCDINRLISFISANYIFDFRIISVDDVSCSRISSSVYDVVDSTNN